jgi:3-hydroxybutyryl-CoA dehydrogenase
LLARLREQGVNVIQRDGSGCCGSVTRCWPGAAGGPSARPGRRLRNLILLDLALDYSKPTRIAISCAAGIDPRAAIRRCPAATGRLQGQPARRLPGLAVLRTVAMLANEAADALLQGVASAADIDLAMRAGSITRGPLAWADATAWHTSLRVLDNLQAPTAKNAIAHRCCAVGSPKEKLP